MIIAAIDPGLSGAIALLRPGPEVWLEVADMPVIQRNGRREVDASEVRDILMSAGPVQVCVIEEVHAMPHDGASGAFRFGASFGAGIAAAQLSGHPIVRVAPGRWKAHYGLSMVKDESRARASEIFPAHRQCWTLKKHHSRAEAALLAWYAALKLVPQVAI